MAKLTKLSKGASQAAIKAAEVRGDKILVTHFKSVQGIHTPSLAQEVCALLADGAVLSSKLDKEVNARVNLERWNWAWYHEQNPFIHASRSM